ncbi:FkbM family methyltransferase [Selenomonas sputigena]|uniref:FkbM family methyltransferase n=1 Tax=Selenomonas sputigena TaxID=69823 RepID=UPI00222EA47C|nr:FkbM family methyltransferase [Selenomonas sputigena]UZD43051.1 FkbM family methyltransferase [Selenomonas sputigena]
MRLEKLYDLYEEGKMPKRLYWELARERLVPLLEVQRIVKKNPYCRSIEIREDGIVLKTQDIAIFFDMTQNICRAETILIGTEGEEIDFMSRFIPAGATIFDIGANVGRVSLGLAKAHEDSMIYAFEPVEETFHGLEKNLRLNGEAEHVKACHMGFYSECGNLKFFVPAANEAASLRPITDTYYFKEGDQGQGERKERMEEIVCPVDTLDNFVETNGITRLDFIKCDTEGAEKMVFSGGTHVFLELRPVVYTEMLRKHAARFDYHPNEIIEMFEGWGYSCYTSVNERLIPFKKMDEATKETNFFFLHDEKHRELLEKYAD